MMTAEVKALAVAPFLFDLSQRSPIPAVAIILEIRGIPMTAQTPSVVERLTHTFSDWLKHRQELNEIRQLNAAEFDRIASDLRVSPADLNELVRHGPHAADELFKLLKALGISDADLARVEP